jgi:hypothetical protein
LNLVWASVLASSGSSPLLIVVAGDRTVVLPISIDVFMMFFTNQITKRDKHALKYLKDINWTKLGDKEGFVLKFSFDSNPYFSNSHLTKTFRMVDGKPKKAMG